MAPRVSVVIPAYNNERFIAETVRSVLAQTFADFEVIIGDHSSTDSTWQVLQQFANDPRVRLVTTPAGGGAKRNWDAVTALATGELVKLVCGDDVIAPQMLERQVTAFDSVPGVEVVASKRNIIDARGGVLVNGRGLAGLSGPMDGAVALRRSVQVGGNIFGEPMCVMMRRSTLVEIGGWDDRQPYYIDMGTYAHGLLRGTFVAVDEVLAGFRVSSSQWSVRLVDEQAKQASAIHRRLRQAHPEVISAADIVRGDVAAHVAALRRRAAYVWLGKRMRAADGN